MQSSSAIACRARLGHLLVALLVRRLHRFLAALARGSHCRGVCTCTCAHLAEAVARRTVLRRVVYGGVDLANLEALTDDEEAEVLARRELATQLARIATEVGARCEHARGAWQTRAAPVVARRETREQARAWLRLCMRAWREQTDGARAHAGRWERRWAHAGAGGDCALAARVRMPAGCAVLWEEEGWRVRVLLEWQRLVNGGRVMAKRSGTVGVTGAHLRRPNVK